MSVSGAGAANFQPSKTLPKETKTEDQSQAAQVAQQTLSATSSGRPKTSLQERVFKPNVRPNFQQASVTVDEAKDMEKSLMPAGARRTFITEGNPKEDPLKEITFEDVKLENGNTLFAGEVASITLYTSDAYRMVNGTLADDTWQINRFMESHGIPSTKKEELKQIARDVAVTLASGMKKMPNFEGDVYRGDTMSAAQIADCKPGKVIVNTRFMSTSQNQRKAYDFVEGNVADEKKRDVNADIYGVLYVINSKTSKDIDRFSVAEQPEAETLYLPESGFQISKVEFSDDWGCHLVHLEEVDLASLPPSTEIHYLV